jgi:hypothetical protein
LYGRVAKTLRVVLLARSPQPPSLVYAFARTRRDTHAPGASRPIRNNCCLLCLSVLIILALRHARNKFACVAANQLFSSLFVCALDFLFCSCGFIKICSEGGVFTSGALMRRKLGHGSSNGTNNHVCSIYYVPHACRCCILIH